ncbi:Mevalonate kinase [Camponotus floridanus]|uniref:Mevalonate kinase n=1 Tax=Camponotus floridanus TaxID=104421 RepID=E2AW63_CAMFO|nr:mevalonate kinase-like [Camponotus floridanus]EFN62320.1 Mevalonate kinase [Camponotus floridanus]
MTSFQISAPGRIILCGEHTVMYGKQVVAASLNLRTMLNFYELPLEPGIVRIDFPDVGINRLDIPLQMITNFISNENYYLVLDDDIIFLRHVQYFITLNGLWSTYEQRFSLQTFFFLLLVIAKNEELVIKSFHVRLTTQLTISAGLGSSTSFATCLAACFLHWSCLQKGDHSEFTSEELIRISTYVMSSEEVIQNYVFNQDHMVCTHGRVTTFQFREPLNTQSEIINTPEMYIMLVDAKICLNKSQRMKQLAYMKCRYGNAADVLLDKIDVISQEIVTILRIIRDQGTNMDLQLLEGLYENLQTNLSLNQDFLLNLDLSHPNFDTICLIAKTCGFKGKLTGDGSSKVIILLPPNYHASEEHRSKVNNLTRCLAEKGFSGEIITISCTGVRLDTDWRNFMD